MSRISALFLLVLAGCSGTAQQGGGLAAGTCRNGPVERPIAWVLPSQQQPQLDPWCAAVGPAVAHAVPSMGRQAGAVDSLLVVSWNVHVGGGDLRRFVADLRSGSLTGGQVPHFALLLQEAWRHGDEVPIPPPGSVAPGRIEKHPPEDRRTSIDRLAGELGLHLLYVPSMRNGAGWVPREDRGNAILSTLPLEDGVALELPLERQRRVAVAGTVRGHTSRGAEWSLQLASVHLENRRPVEAGPVGLSGATARARQMAWLLAALPPARTAVLAGDLNTWTRGPDEDVVQLTLPHFGDTAPLPPGPTHVSHVVFRERLDYIFARIPGGSMSGYARAPSAYGSDHYPVLAWIRVQGAEGTGAGT